MGFFNNNSAQQPRFKDGCRRRRALISFYLVLLLLVTSRMLLSGLGDDLSYYWQGIGMPGGRTDRRFASDWQVLKVNLHLICRGLEGMEFHCLRWLHVICRSRGRTVMIKGIPSGTLRV